MDLPAIVRSQRRGQRRRVEVEGRRMVISWGAGVLLFVLTGRYVESMVVMSMVSVGEILLAPFNL